MGKQQAKHILSKMGGSGHSLAEKRQVKREEQKEGRLKGREGKGKTTGQIKMGLDTHDSKLGPFLWEYEGRVANPGPVL